MIKYYVLIDGSQQGPYTYNQLAGLWDAGKITSETLYWTDGMGSEWLPIEDMFEPAPPPIVPRYMPQIEPPAASKKKPASGCALAIIAIVVVGGIGAISDCSKPNKRASTYSFGDSAAFRDVGKTAGAEAARGLHRKGAGKMPLANQQRLAMQVAKNRGIADSQISAFVNGYVDGYSTEWDRISK